MNDIAQELLDTVTPYWEAEAEVSKRFFEGNPSNDGHVYWLRAQIWKELHPVDGYFNGIHQELVNMANMFPGIDKTVDRHHFSFLMKQMLEEFEHYVMFADIFEEIVGRKIDVDADPVQLPEERKLQELRQRYVASGSPIDKAAVLFTEGGGAAMFREGAKVRGGKLESMIARAMQIIYDDEKDHFREGAREAAELIRTREDAERMKSAIRDVSRQRVSMRLEMFRSPMSEADADAFVAAQARAIGTSAKGA
ncbi:MAG: hypothetical protein LXA50_09480 [Betaproteobacteria bacterium]|jgi:hypothetical protein|nr:hypothetical protein [Betaproteobacteria bacterium]